MLYTVILLLSLFSPKKDAYCCDCESNPICPDSPVSAAQTRSSRP